MYFAVSSQNVTERQFGIFLTSEQYVASEIRRNKNMTTFVFRLVH